MNDPELEFENSGQAFEYDLDEITEVEAEITEESKQED